MRVRVRTLGGSGCELAAGAGGLRTVRELKAKARRRRTCAETCLARSLFANAYCALQTGMSVLPYAPSIPERTAAERVETVLSKVQEHLLVPARQQRLLYGHHQSKNQQLLSATPIAGIVAGSKHINSRISIFSMLCLLDMFRCGPGNVSIRHWHPGVFDTNLFTLQLAHQYSGQKVQWLSLTSSEPHLRPFRFC